MLNDQSLIYAANWKMNMGLKQAQSFISHFKTQIQKEEMKNFIFFVPALLSLLFSKEDWNWGGQNGSFKTQGALTGENSLEVLKELGAQFCLLGHSERRYLFKESQPEIKQKFYLMKELGITPLLCVGEKEQEGDKEIFLKNQLQDFKNEKDFLIAYEPVWSIGTGKTPSPEEINETHCFIKEFIKSSPPVLYGGSVNSENAVSFSKQKYVNGFLVGGSSLKSDEFYNIYARIKKL